MTEHPSPLELSKTEQAVIDVNDAIQAWGIGSFRLEQGRQTYDVSIHPLDTAGTESDYDVVIYGTPAAASVFQGSVRMQDGQRRGISRESVFEEQWGDEEIEILVQPDGTEEEGQRKVSSNPMRQVSIDDFANYAPHLIELLTTKSSDRELTRINQLMAELTAFELSNAPDPKVSQALEIVNNVMEKHKNILISKGVLVTYHGSMQYNDPRHLDLDLVFTTQDEDTIQSLKQYLGEIEDEFEQVKNWPMMGHNKGRCNTNFEWYSIEGVQQELKDWENGDLPYYEDNCYLDVHAGYLLSSKSLFPEQLSLLEAQRNEIRILLESSPMMRHEATRSLLEAVDARRERRQRGYSRR